MPLDIAVRKLNNGYTTSAIAALLGVRVTANTPWRPGKLSQQKHLVVYNFYHAAYASRGHYDFSESKTGKAKLSNFRWNHNGPDHLYNAYLREIKEAFQVVDALPGKQ